MFESQTSAEVGPGDHHDGRLWQFSDIIGRPVALMSAVQSDMFIALPHLQGRVVAVAVATFHRVTFRFAFTLALTFALTLALTFALMARPQQSLCGERGPRR